VNQFIAAVVTAIFICAAVPARAQSPSEYQVIAAMLFNFTKYVEWPADSIAASNQLSICIAGLESFKGSMDIYQNRLSKGNIIRIRGVKGPQDVRGCNLLFIDDSEEDKLAAYTFQTAKMPVLTASNIRHFADHNGIIGFFKQDDRIRFEINIEASKQSRLFISSNLLKLAKIVQ
jgi:hypothetical protein